MHENFGEGLRHDQMMAQPLYPERIKSISPKVAAPAATLGVRQTKPPPLGVESMMQLRGVILPNVEMDFDSTLSGLRCIRISHPGELVPSNPGLSDGIPLGFPQNNPVGVS